MCQKSRKIQGRMIIRTIRQADSYFWGVHAQEIPRGKPEAGFALPSRPLPHDIVTGGIPHAGSWQITSQLEEHMT